MSAPAFRSAGLSIAGRQRDHNEDAFLEDAAAGLWAVADGMGGHAAGDVASRMIIEHLARIESDTSLVTMCERIESALAEINDTLQAQSEGDERRLMGSTVVFLLARDGLLLCGWAGDSRAYCLRDGVLTRLSRDHSHVEDLVARGQISGAEAREHPDANIVTRAIGGESRLVLEFSLSQPRTGDRYFLCSDGIDKELDDTQLRALLGGEADAAACNERVIRAADLAGGRDNITGVVIDVTQGSGEALSGLPGAQQALGGLCEDVHRQRINFDNFRLRRARLIEELLDPSQIDEAAMMETQTMGIRPLSSRPPPETPAESPPEPPPPPAASQTPGSQALWWAVALLAAVLGLAGLGWVLA